MLRNIALLLLLLAVNTIDTYVVFAQSPVSTFTAPSVACLQETLPIKNNSSSPALYEWDFCADDFQTLKTNFDLASLTGLVNGFGYKLVEDNGLWFAFVVSQTGARIFRIDLGDSPLNFPLQVADLGNPGNALSFPQDIEIYKANGIWYGFVGFNDPNYGIVKLDFGSTITNNSPTAINIGNFGVSGRFWDLKIVTQSTDLVLLISERNSGSLIRVNFRDSFNNTISNSTHVFVTSPITI
ncbi:MAG: hypothetical protein HYZ42_07340, partial [Bacteroidetes bacterium]|nr:hypothetical protein [Bacteroidota bacterium]